MVLPKKLEYQFNGYQLPADARAPRSARKRRVFKKTDEDNRMWAFDLLATVAGNLLKDDSSRPCDSAPNWGDKCEVVQNTVKMECPNDNESAKVDTFDGPNCVSGFSEPKIVEEAHQECSFMVDSTHERDTHSECSNRFDPQKSVDGNVKNAKSGFTGKADTGPLGLRSSGVCCKLDCDGKLITENKPNRSSDCSIEVPISGNPIPTSSFLVTREYVNLFSKDDDENSSGCTHPCTPKRSFRPVARNADRRIRKILASRYRKVAQKSKNAARSYADFKPTYYHRNNSYKRLRSESNYPIKKRKYFNSVAISNSDGGLSSEDATDARRKNINNNASFFSHSKMHRGAGVSSSSLRARRASFASRDSHVKLRIKSFRVPELFIEIPETATIGSLKRTVLEAVSAILGGGVRVGVLLQGKKVRDDTKTLLQTGISKQNETDAVGFCLEPNPSNNPRALCREESSSQLPCNTPQPITSYSPSRGVLQQNASHKTGTCIESDHDSAPSPSDISADKDPEDARALVPVPEMNPESLDMVVSPNKKFRRPDAGQRRIRRPFSVTEVEALVQAVEKLGTGRWRDVKLRAFDNAKHRTYVDLKDKWKTLVHTAKISPQQRRGEPVPQELLDRVLSAHAYWCQSSPQPQSQLQLQHQSKQPQAKQPEADEIYCIL